MWQRAQSVLHHGLQGGRYTYRSWTSPIKATAVPDALSRVDGVPILGRESKQAIKSGVASKRSCRIGLAVMVMGSTLQHTNFKDVLAYEQKIPPHLSHKWLPR